MGHFQALYLMSPQQRPFGFGTLAVMTWPPKLKVGKTFNQHSYFKSEEKMDKYRKGSVVVVVVVCVCIYGENRGLFLRIA